MGQDWMRGYGEDVHHGEIGASSGEGAGASYEEGAGASYGEGAGARYKEGSGASYGEGAGARYKEGSTHLVVAAHWQRDEVAALISSADDAAAIARARDHERGAMHEGDESAGARRGSVDLPKWAVQKLRMGGGGGR